MLNQIKKLFNSVGYVQKLKLFYILRSNNLLERLIKIINLILIKYNY